MNTQHPCLLIKYSYPLNGNHSKQLSIGYDSKTLNLCLLLQNFTRGTDYISFAASDWFAIFLTETRIKEYFKTDNNNSNNFEIDNADIKTVLSTKNIVQRYNIIQSNTQNEQILKTLNITVLTYTDQNKRKHIVFQTTDEKRVLQVILNEAEFNKLISYGEIIKYHIHNYNVAALDVRNYYCVYRSKCIFKNCSYLEKHDIIRPYVQSCELLHFNYSRLFIEIGLFCRDKISKEVKCMLKNKTT